MALDNPNLTIRGVEWGEFDSPKLSFDRGGDTTPDYPMFSVEEYGPEVVVIEEAPDIFTEDMKLVIPYGDLGDMTYEQLQAEKEAEPAVSKRRLAIIEAQIRLGGGKVPTAEGTPEKPEVDKEKPTTWWREHWWQVTKAGVGIVGAMLDKDKQNEMAWAANSILQQELELEWAKLDWEKNKGGSGAHMHNINAFS